MILLNEGPIMYAETLSDRESNNVNSFWHNLSLWGSLCTASLGLAPIGMRGNFKNQDHLSISPATVFPSSTHIASHNSEAIPIQVSR
jgi:hypothetical protein